MRAKLASCAVTLALSTLFLGTSTTAAHAYLDAGTGSMLLQILLGGFAGLMIAGKLYWHRLLTFLGLRKEAPEGAAEMGDGALARAKAQPEK